jgi:WD40 repeat protein
MGRLVAIAAVEEPVVHRVIEAYRAPGVTFLMPPVPSALEDDSVIDISHESLMRVWGRLRGWVEEEAQSARIYRRLHETAALHAEKRAGLYHDPDLQIALSWREANGPNSAWAAQYGGEFDETMAFLDASREAVEREERQREAARQLELERARQLAESQAKVARLFKRFAAGLAAGLCLAVALTVWAFLLRQEAERQEAAADEQRRIAQEKEREADRQRKTAQAAEREMQRIAAQAETAKEIAQRENYRSTIKLAESMLHGDAQARYRVADILWGAQPELRGWEWGHLMARCPLEEWSLQTNQGGLDALAASADGRFLATAGPDGTVALWDSWTRSELWRRKTGLADTLEIDPRSRFVGVGSAELSRPAFRILDIARGRIVHEAAGTGTAGVAFSSSGKDFYVLARRNLERISTDTWVRLASVVVPIPIREAAPRLFVDSAGAYVGVNDAVNRPPEERSRNQPRSALFDAHTLRPVTDLDSILPTYASNFYSMAKPVLHSGLGKIVYSDGSLLYSHGLVADGRSPGQEVPRIVHRSVVDHLAYDARSETIVAASNDGTVTLRDGDGETRTLSHGSPIRRLALFADGRFVTGGADGLLKCWKPSQSANLAANTSASPSGASDGLLAFANNGDQLLYRTWETKSHFLYDMSGLTYRGFLRPEAGDYGNAFPRIQPGTNELVVDNERGLAFYSLPRIQPGTNELVVDNERGLAFYSLLPNGTGFAKTRSIDFARTFGAAFDATGRILVVSNRDQELAVFDLSSHQRLPVPEARGFGYVSVNPAGTRAALLTDSRLQVWDVVTGRLLNRLDWDASSFTAPDEHGHRMSIHHEAVNLGVPVFHPNGDLLAFVKESEDSSSLVLWDTALGKVHSSIQGQPGLRFNSCVFTPDGNRILTPCSDAKMRLWDWRIGKELFALSDAAQTNLVAANPDGVTIAYSGWHPSLRIAKALPWNELTQRDTDFYRAVDDLWTYSARRATWVKGQTLIHENEAIVSNKDQAETLKFIDEHIEIINADEAEILGDIQRRRGHDDQALPHYTRAIEIRQKLVLADPLKAELQYRLAAVYEKCLAVGGADSPPKGAAVLQQAVEFWQSLVSGGRTHSAGRRYLLDFQLRLVDSQLARNGKDAKDALLTEMVLWSEQPRQGLDDRLVLYGLRELEARLAAVAPNMSKRFSAMLRGEGKPVDNAERKRLAQFAYYHKKYACSARLWAEALESDPKTGDSRQTLDRYDAARAAALAAAGKGQDEPPLDDAAKAKLRRQALDWLKIELAVWDKLLDSAGRPSRSTLGRTLSHWQQDTGLAGIRDVATLAKIPAEEQAALTRFWADVAALLKRAEEPADNTERLAFAQIAYDQKKFASATRLWAEALASDPKLGDDRRMQHRYNAACAAALAAAGQGKDDPRPEDGAKAKLRKQALIWLEAELSAWTKLLESGPSQAKLFIAGTLKHWKQDTDLASVRDEQELAKLPEADRAAWKTFWADVDALLKRAEKPSS